MKRINKILSVVLLFLAITVNAQSIIAIQQQNSRATGYAIVASRNPGKSFSINLIKWDGVHDLEYNANNQINPGWHPQAVIKGSYFNQAFDGNDFTAYSSVIVSQAEFDIYKSTGTEWWIVCSTLPSYSNSNVNISEIGNVGIGIVNPKNKLDVDGTIHSRKVKVDMNGWSDFVFKKGYNLRTLEEVEKHINENGHLENIPSEDDVLKNGISLGEMDSKLLQKIEELTLYSIKQNKEMKKLMQENEILKEILERILRLENELLKK